MLPGSKAVEGLWSSLKGSELVNLAADRLVEVADAAERGIRRVCAQDRLP